MLRIYVNIQWVSSLQLWRRFADYPDSGGRVQSRGIVSTANRVRAAKAAAEEAEGEGEEAEGEEKRATKESYMSPVAQSLADALQDAEPPFKDTASAGATTDAVNAVFAGLKGASGEADEGDEEADIVVAQKRAKSQFAGPV